MGLRTILASAVLAALCGAAAAQERVQLKISSFTPPPHWTNSQLFQPWAQELEKKSGGKVRAQLFAGNSEFGKIENQTDQVKAGATDLAWVMNGVPRGRSALAHHGPAVHGPRCALVHARHVGDAAHAPEGGLRRVQGARHHLPQRGRLLLPRAQGRAHRGGQELRVRSPSSQVQAWLQHVGAVPVTMGPGQIYESLEKGTMDGILTVYDGIRGFRLESLAKHALSARVYVTCFNITMNQDKYNGLPADVKKLIDDTTGERWVETMPALWDKNDEAGRQLALSKGLQVVRSPKSSATSGASRRSR